MSDDKHRLAPSGPPSLPDQAQLVPLARFGPLPPATILADYDVISPGAAREILDMASRAQMHDHEMESATLAAETAYRRLGLLSAAATVAVIILGAVICALRGHDVVAIALGGVAALTAIGQRFRPRTFRSLTQRRS